MKTLVLAFVCIAAECGGPSGGGGGTGGGGTGGGSSGRREYPQSVHVKLSVKYGSGAKDNGTGNTRLNSERWVGVFEGNSSSSRISGVNMVYTFENTIDTFASASHYRKNCDGAGPCDERTDTVTGLTRSKFEITVGPTSFNLQTGELFGPFYGFVFADPSGVVADASGTRIDFDAEIPAKLDSRCPADPNVKTGNIIALDGDVYTGYTIRQTYTCTADSTVFSFENSVQVSAL